MLSTGEILEKYLRNRMSMTDLANILVISPQYISSVINNVKRPSKNFLDKFYMIFDVLPEDKELIENYEKFRRLPEDFQNEFLRLKNNSLVDVSKDSDIVHVPLKAVVETGVGLLNKLEREEIISISNINSISEESFFLRVYGSELEPEFKNKDLVLVDTNISSDLYLLNNKLCVIRYNNDLFLKKIEYLKDIIILRCVNDKLNPIILTGDNLESVKFLGRIKQVIRFID